MPNQTAPAPLTYCCSLVFRARPKSTCAQIVGRFLAAYRVGKVVPAVTPRFDFPMDLADGPKLRFRAASYSVLTVVRPQPMIFRETRLKGVFEIDLELQRDERGLFARSYCCARVRGAWPESPGRPVQRLLQPAARHAARHALPGSAATRKPS